MTIRVVNPNDIKFEKDCYPRSGGIDNQYIDLLQLADWNALPPIVVNEDLILVDGWHRLTLAKMRNLSQVKVNQRNIPREKILEEAVRLNAKFGMQLSQSDKRRVARRLFQDGTHKISSLAKLLSVTTRFINKWTSDIRTEREKSRNEEILDLYLEGWNEAEIGRKIGHLKRSQIYNIIAESKKGINSQIGLPDPPQIGDVWLFTSCDDAYGISGFPGRIPGQIIENLLHFYTKPFDKVVDPMAGSGTTMDVCKAMYRRCLAYDLKPMKENIALHNIRRGFPPRARRCDFIILDPPYYQKKDEVYHPESISNLPRQEYLAAFAKLAHDSYRILNKGGHLALVMSNYLDEDPKGSVWLWDYIELFTKAKFTPIREIQSPLSDQSLHPGHIEQFRKSKRMAKFTRSIVVFKCK